MCKSGVWMHVCVELSAKKVLLTEVLTDCWTL